MWNVHKYNHDYEQALLGEGGNKITITRKQVADLITERVVLAVELAVNQLRLSDTPKGYPSYFDAQKEIEKRISGILKSDETPTKTTKS